jgi:hypothetical protein
MPRYEVRNKVTRMVLGAVVVDYDEDVLGALARETQSTVEEIAHSLGSTAEEAKAALEIVLLPDAHAARSAPSGKGKLVNRLPPRRLYS